MNEFKHSTYPEVFVQLRPSQLVIGEIGAFALKNFKKSDIIVHSKDFEDNNIMSMEEYEKFDQKTKELLMAHSTMTPDHLFIPKNLNFIKPINYFNHSCEPNVGFDADDNYIAIRDITLDEEFLLDYSFLNTTPHYSFSCRCASIVCRKTITGNEWKNSIFWKKNEPYFASTLREIKSKSE